MTIDTESEKRAYWDSYYKSQPSTKSAPSQFAAFVAQEVGDAMIIEIGCGNGRDALFFAQQGFRVLGIDGSPEAIDKCTISAANIDLPGAKFACARAGSEDFKLVLADARREYEGTVVAYARFFLHAISEEEQGAVFSDLSSALVSGDRVALEYRTTRDAIGPKVTAAHYRRYINPPDVFAAAWRLGFAVEYAVEGYGLAKYKQDDAYVARCILRKS